MKVSENTIFSFIGVLLFGCVLLCGCNSNAFLKSLSTNTPLQDDSFLLSNHIVSADTVTLEIFLVRLPFNDEELNSSLWADVDEQIFDVSQRREMGENGFRIGLIGNQLPTSFLRILGTRDDQNPNQYVTTIRLDEMMESQHIMRKTIGSRNGQKNEINVSDIKKQATVLFNEKGALGGETFSDAQGVLVVRTQTRGDGSVTLEFLPEIQYGQPRQTFAYDAGAVTMVTARPSRSFDTMRGEINVHPGQFVIMTCRPEMGGNAGYFFFVNDEADGGAEQKLLCMRVLQTNHNEMYTQDGTLPMDPSDSGHDAEQEAKKEAE